jgi:glycosyltransferase involved in cell wall biosynthesis
MKDRGNKKILILSGIQIYPPTSGGQLRSSALAEALAERGFEVAIYSFTGRKEEYLSGKPSGWNRVSDRITEFVDRSRLFGICQWLSYRLDLPSVWLSVLLGLSIPSGAKADLARADVVVLDFPFAYPALRGCLKPKFLHSHNLEHRIWRGWKSWWVRAVEKAAARASDGILCCSEEEEVFFRRETSASHPLFRLNNRVDGRRFLPDPVARRRIRAAVGAADDERLILFSASAYRPNEEAFSFLRRFARDHGDLLERLRLRILVVGSVSPSEVREGRLIATGRVEAVEPYFQASDLAVNPVMQGSGTSLKLLEFVAAGLPVLSTDFGARGFELRPGEDYIGFTWESLPAVLESTLSESEAPAHLRKVAESARARLGSFEDAIEKWVTML